MQNNIKNININNDSTFVLNDISYIESVNKRVLPSFRKIRETSVYNEFCTNSKVKQYFKRYYKFVELPGLEKIVSKSKYYDKKFFDLIRSKINLTNDSFLQRLDESTTEFSKTNNIKLNSNNLKFIYHCYRNKILLGSYTNIAEGVSKLMPNKYDVLSKQNYSASVGLPTPWIKKRQIAPELSKLLDKFYRFNISYNDIFNNSTMFSAAFKRNQITNKDYKTRLVFAVNAYIACLESFYDTWFKRVLKYALCNKSCLVHGYTQLDISKTMRKFKHLHSYSFDVVKFDEHMNSVVLLLAFLLFSRTLGINGYYLRVFNLLRNNFLTLPVFHPSIGLRPRLKGITSGSGFTSSIGSFCMFIIHCYSIYQYCIKKSINPYKLFFDIRVSSDDSCLGFKEQLDVDLYISIVKSTFYIDLELECYSKPGKCKMIFLGSTWREGKPYRNPNRLLARIVFGSGNIPKMDTNTLLFSRAYEILGNVCNFREILSTFYDGKIKIPKRIFRFLELGDYNQQIKIRSRMKGGESRGYWSNTDMMNISSLNTVWRTR